jgi:hypothetical protein
MQMHSSLAMGFPKINILAKETQLTKLQLSDMILGDLHIVLPQLVNLTHLQLRTAPNLIPSHTLPRSLRTYINDGALGLLVDWPEPKESTFPALTVLHFSAIFTFPTQDPFSSPCFASIRELCLLTDGWSASDLNQAVLPLTALETIQSNIPGLSEQLSRPITVQEFAETTVCSHVAPELI